MDRSTVSYQYVVSHVIWEVFKKQKKSCHRGRTSLLLYAPSKLPSYFCSAVGGLKLLQCNYYKWYYQQGLIQVAG